MSERVFPASPRRREQARQEGRFPRSRDLTPVAILLAGLIWIGSQGVHWFRGMATSLRESLTQASPDIDAHQLPTLLQGHVATLGLSVATLFATVTIVACATQWWQVGWQWSLRSLQPRLDRILGGHLWPKNRGFAEGLLVVLRLVAAGSGFLGGWQWVPALTDSPVSTWAWNAVSTPLLGAAWGLAGVAALEAGYRWWRHERELRMTADEFRDEQREQSGDLRVRAMRRNAHRDLVN